jgi:hypothetical protein
MQLKLSSSTVSMSPNRCSPHHLYSCETGTDIPLRACWRRTWRCDFKHHASLVPRRASTTLRAPELDLEDPASLIMFHAGVSLSLEGAANESPVSGASRPGGSGRTGRDRGNRDLRLLPLGQERGCHRATNGSRRSYDPDACCFREGVRGTEALAPARDDSLHL